MTRVARLSALLALAAAPSGGGENPPQVAFKQFPGDRQAIVRLDQEGGNPIELTRGHPIPSAFGAFDWSPDGSRLVYASEGVVGGDLYTLDADGSGLTRLTSGGGNDDPAWSPDGSRIAYVHTVRVRRPSGLFRLDEEIWLVAADGRDARALTRSAREARAPQWSPDGSRILYTGLTGTVVVDADTGRMLLRIAGAGGRWAPDGSRIALQARSDIDVVNADGTGRRTVAAAAGAPRWSPDGTRVAFWRTHCTPGIKGLCGAVLAAVYTVEADGRGERRLTGPISGGPGSQLDGFPADFSSAPSWWPDGSRLFFAHQGYAHVMNADGTCERPFGPANLLLGTPAWRPGSPPTLPPLRCVGLAVRAMAERDAVGVRGDARVHVAIENDGTEEAAELKLTLRLAYGRGRILLPLPSCRRTSVVEWDLAPLPAGGATRLVVRVANPRPIVFHLRAGVAAREARAGSALAYVVVMNCDVLGTARPDRLVGTARRDRICGLGGPDTVAAGGGNDVVRGGAGADRIACGPGRDTVVADRLDIVARDCERVLATREPPRQRQPQRRVPGRRGR